MILIIDNYDSFTYNLYQSVAQIHDKVHVVRNDQITVSEIKQIKPKGIILSPGPGYPENAGICVDLVQALGADIPMLGVCLGHQAIVVAYGGKVVQADEISHAKKDMIFHHRKGLYANLSLPLEVGRYHSLIAEKRSLPKDLIIEAENANEIIMGVRHKEHSVFGIQFHPESILTPKGDKMLENFVMLMKTEGKSCG